MMIEINVTECVATSMIRTPARFLPRGGAVRNGSLNFAMAHEH
jgi:hypothetical protein